MGSATQFSLHEGDESSRFRNSPIGIPSAGDDGSWKVRQPFSDTSVLSWPWQNWQESNLEVRRTYLRIPFKPSYQNDTAFEWV